MADDSNRTKKKKKIADSNRERFNPKMMISDLPRDMAEEVLSRLPVTSLSQVRSTCKKWNTLTKSQGFLKKHFEMKKQRNGIEVVMMLESRVSLMSINLPSIERIGNLDADQVDIPKIFHCDGLFLCSTSSGLVVWNPFLGQTRWIQPTTSYHRWDMYALGYEMKNKYSKVLRFLHSFDPDVDRRVCEFEIFRLNSSSSWEVLVDLNLDWGMSFHHRGVSVKGNAYWYAHQKIALDGPPVIRDLPDFLLSFDFTTERFGPRLPLPFHGFFGDTVSLSSVGEEQLAVLFQKRFTPAYTVKIWITTKIEPNAVSWGTKVFLTVDLKPLLGFKFAVYAGSFFIDEKKNMAMVLDKGRDTSRNVAYIIGTDGYLKQVDLGESRNICCYPRVCSYVPSSLQIEQPANTHT